MAAEKLTTATEVPDIQIDDELEQRSKLDSLSNGNGSDSDKEKLNLENKIRLIPRPPPKQESYDSVSSNGEEEDAELTDELRAKIIEQAEYYFSDENLKRDGFLLKHVKRNKEGFVNLKLLASFKKMRSLSRDYRAIGEALKDSTNLLVNENGLKIRRANPLPKELLDQARVKNLVVSKMPHDNPSMDYVIAAFPGHNDDVISVRVVKPGKMFPNDLQSHFSRHPELNDQIVAVVEFDSPENAAAAIKVVDKEKYVGMDVKLLELGPKQAKRMSGNSESAASDTPIDSESGGHKKTAKKKTGNRLLEVNGQDDSSYASSSDSDWSSFSSCRKRYSRSHGGSKAPSPSTSLKCRSPIDMYSPRNKLSSGDSPRSPQKGRKTIDHSPIRKVSPLAALESPRSSPEAQRKFVKYDTEKGDRLSPWMFQRMQLSRNTENDNCSQKHLEVIRQPKGPDGSFGFSNHPLKKYVLVHAY